MSRNLIEELKALEPTEEPTDSERRAVESARAARQAIFSTREVFMLCAAVVAGFVCGLIFFH